MFENADYLKIVVKRNKHNVGRKWRAYVVGMPIPQNGETAREIDGLGSGHGGETVISSVVFALDQFPELWDEQMEMRKYMRIEDEKLSAKLAAEEEAKSKIREDMMEWAPFSKEQLKDMEEKELRNVYDNCMLLIEKLHAQAKAVIAEGDRRAKPQ